MEDYTVTYENLRLAPFKVEHIVALSLSKSVNEHGTLEVTAILSEEIGDQYIYLVKNLMPVTLSDRNGPGKEEILFKGLVTNINISKSGNVYYMQLSAKGSTCLMAVERKSRSFQDVTMTTHRLIGEIIAGYEGADVLIQIPDEPIGSLLVQYQETDWEFLKRLVSRYGAVLISDICMDGIAIFAGVADRGESHKISAFQYTVRKSIESYELMKKNGWPDANEIEYIVFEVENPRVFAIGTQVELDGKQLFIEQAWHTLNDGVLHNLYLLKLKEGFRSLKAYNTMLVGSSVSGKVVEVSRDRVMVDLDIDGPGRAAYWFPYSTMSASPDGSGWYCMPEKGDGVRVYFPTKEEGEAYAVCAISGHKPAAGDNNDPMGDPNVKYLATVHQKVIKFAEEGIIINADNGQATVFLGKDGKLLLYGAQKVEVAAEEVSIMAKNNVTIAAQNLVTLKNGLSHINVYKSGNVIIKGTKVYSN